MYGVKGSPQWLENILNTYIERICTVFDRRFSRSEYSWISVLWPWLLMAVCLVTYLQMPRTPIPHSLDLGGRLSVIPLAIGLSILIGLIRESGIGEETRESLCMAVGALAFVALTANASGPFQLKFSRVCIEVLLPLAFFFCPVGTRWNRLKILVGFVLLFALPLLSAYNEYYIIERAGARNVQIRYFIPVMLPLLAWLAVQTRPSWLHWMRAAAILFSPAQIIAKTALLPSFIKSEPGRRSRFIGLSLVAIGLLHLGVMAKVFGDVRIFEERFDSSLLDFLEIGFLNYIRFYLFIYGTSSIARGLFWLSGWSVPPFFNFAWLAVSPQERWRRWDIPVYLTYRLFVFLPVLRRTGNLFLAIMLTFLVVGSSYIFQPLFLLLSAHPADPLSNIEKNYVFYVLQGLLVYFGILTRGWWPESGSRKAWFGVLLTTFLMSLCYGVRR